MMLAIRLAQQLPLGIPTGSPDYGRILQNMIFLLLWVVVASIGFAVAVPIAMRVFNRMTPGVDEMAELRKGKFPLPQPSPQAPAGDPRVARIKAALEAKQFTVHAAGVFRGTGFYQGGSEVELFCANVAATYAQSTHEKVNHQALLMWDAMYSVSSKESPASILSGRRSGRSTV